MTFVQSQIANPSVSLDDISGAVVNSIMEIIDGDNR